MAGLPTTGRMPLTPNTYSYTELAKITNVLYDTLAYSSPFSNDDLGQVEPKDEYKRLGLIAYADGTNWNPGNGAGWYWYDGSAWIIFKNTEDGTAQGQMLFWDNTLKLWVHSETNEIVWDDTNKRVGIGVAAPQAKFDVLGTARFGDSATNYTGFEADGTMAMSGAATVWKDVFFPMSPPKTTGAGNPSLVTWLGNLRGYSFAVNDVHDFDPQEFPHDGKQASTATFHIHWISRTNVAAIRTVKWEIEYSQANHSAVFPATTTASVEVSIPANTTALTHYMTDITTFTTGNIASQMYVRLKRIAASGTAPADDPVVIGVHYHYELDTIGSRSISTK